MAKTTRRKRAGVSSDQTSGRLYADTKDSNVIVCPCVYFIQCMGEENPIKIGHTWAPLSLWLTKLQVSSPFELKVLGIIKNWNPRDLEKQLHERFQSSWMRGEWHRSSKELLGYIAENTVPASEQEESADP